METTGYLKGITKDWISGDFIITLGVYDKLNQEIVEEIQGCNLDIVIKKKRKKRSLDSNAYLWVLLTKIAEVVDSSKDEIYEEMLQKYGVLYQDENGDYVVITLKSSIDISKVDGHWKLYQSNGKFSAYLMIKGTSEYNTSEMAKFLDMVILEAKELGIETATPNEVARMNALWGERIGENSITN